MRGRSRVRIISPIPSIPESEDSGGDDHLDSGNQEPDVPAHHQVLYDFLGKDKAESFLNPKIEEPSARRQSIHPDGRPAKLLPRIDTGMGAEEKSDKKILRLERRIPEEWKQAYNSYLRDRLAKDKPLHFRSFTEKPDVPDLNVLTRHDYVYKVRRIRNHSNVMFRSSEQNLDRTALLLNNNPPPVCRQEEKLATLDRYFDKDTLKPTEPRQLAIEPPEETAFRESPRNLHFLSEAAARCKGTFYGKYAHEDTMKMVTDVPGHNVKLPDTMTERISISAPMNTPTARKVWRTHAKKITPSREATWHPLTFGSLMEYSSSKTVVGTGEYSHGIASRWRNTATAPN